MSIWEKQGRSSSRLVVQHVLAVQFGLTENPQETADKLASMIKAAGRE